LNPELIEQPVGVWLELPGLLQQSLFLRLAVAQEVIVGFCHPIFPT
jgi:hypothetical protein